MLSPSTVTTPGKAPPPSPLYYDYTEDFDIDDYNRTATIEPPPQFRIERTIPEDRPLSADRPASEVIYYNSDPNHSFGTRTSSLANSIRVPSHVGTQKLRDPSSGRESFTKLQSSHSLNAAISDTGASESAPSSGRKIVRLSGLGVGARELNLHVEEAFGLLPSRSFEILVPDGNDNAANLGETRYYHSFEHDRREPQTTIRRSNSDMSTSNRGLVLYKQAYRNPAGQDMNFLQQELSFSRVPNSQGQPNLTSTNFGELRAQMGENEVDNQSRQISRNKFKSPPIDRSSGFYSIDSGLNEFARLLTAYDEPSQVACLEDSLAPHNGLRRTPMDSPTLTRETLVHSRSCSNSSNPPTSSFNKQGRTKDQTITASGGLRRDHQHGKERRMEAFTVPNYGETSIPNFSHQISRKIMSRSESPMLAPKPISPARQLKLKNSVPQLMKALPSLPPDPSFRAVPPPEQLASLETELPCRFSPLLPEDKRIPLQETERIPSPCYTIEKNGLQQVGKMTEPIELDSAPVREPSANYDDNNVETPPQAPLKLKLKKRSSVLPPTTPGDSQSWNTENGYPWSDQPANVPVPTSIQNEQTLKPRPPKFKLKVTRASNSTVGTVRVNRESGDQRPTGTLNFRNPKDLFTPSGFENIFRQVSRHIRKSSRNSNQLSGESTAEPIPTSGQLSTNQSMNLDSVISQPSPLSANSSGLSEVRSFFSDDSSHLQDNQTLRKRLSNLRARITVPYAARNASHSFDDIVWRDRNNQEEVKTPTVARSITHLNEARTNAASTQLRHLTQHKLYTQKLRAKVSEWFKGARSAIAARVKSRSGSGRD